jgi:hypothetical protein
MKRKSPRGIPDFSSKGPKSRIAQKPDKQSPAPVKTVTPSVKPQATSSKSGRRGS